MGQLDLSVPSLSRAWDYLLGGKNNFQVDRDAVDGMFDVFTGWRALALMQRRFLGRAVQYLVAEAGIRQIIDVGSGFPTRMNVHEMAQQIEPDARVLYVDNDPSVLAHARAIVADDRRSAAILADVTTPMTILRHPMTRRLLDLREPYAVLLCGVLHHLADDQGPMSVTQQLQEAMTPGSYLVMSNFLDDDSPLAAEAERAIHKALGTGRFRTWEEQTPYLYGLGPVEPRFVYADDWRPDEFTPKNSPEHTFLAAGVGQVAG
jgi:hypothetical protein